MTYKTLPVRFSRICQRLAGATTCALLLGLMAASGALALVALPPDGSPSPTVQSETQRSAEQQSAPRIHDSSLPVKDPDAPPSASTAPAAPAATDSPSALTNALAAHERSEQPRTAASAPPAQEGGRRSLGIVLIVASGLGMLGLGLGRLVLNTASRSSAREAASYQTSWSKYTMS